MICNYDVATGTDTCGANVADAGAPPTITPTGQVRFSSNFGGTFRGDSCTLAQTPDSPGVASCTVQFLPPPTQPVIQPGGVSATYAGDAEHSGSGGATQLLGTIPTMGADNFPTGGCGSTGSSAARDTASAHLPAPMARGAVSRSPQWERERWSPRLSYRRRRPRRPACSSRGLRHSGSPLGVRWRGPSPESRRSSWAVRSLARATRRTRAIPRSRCRRWREAHAASRRLRRRTQGQQLPLAAPPFERVSHGAAADRPGDPRGSDRHQPTVERDRCERQRGDRASIAAEKAYYGQLSAADNTLTSSARALRGSPPPDRPRHDVVGVEHRQQDAEAATAAFIGDGQAARRTARESQGGQPAAQLNSRSSQRKREVDAAWAHSNQPLAAAWRWSRTSPASSPIYRSMTVENLRALVYGLARSRRSRRGMRTSSCPTWGAPRDDPTSPGSALTPASSLPPSTPHFSRFAAVPVARAKSCT